MSNDATQGEGKLLPGIEVVRRTLKIMSEIVSLPAL